MIEMIDPAATLKQIQALPEKINNEALQILINQAELIVGLAQINVKVKTGRLQSTIRYEITVNTDNTKQVTIRAGGFGVEYAAIVEAKYPYLKPAIDEVAPSLEQQLQNNIQGVLDGSR
jgi:hypothetical protein